MKFRIILPMPKKICTRILIGIPLNPEIHLERTDNLPSSPVP